MFINIINLIVITVTYREDLTTSHKQSMIFGMDLSPASGQRGKQAVTRWAESLMMLVAFLGQILNEWQCGPKSLMCRPHHSPQDLSIWGATVLIPERGQNTLCGASIESSEEWWTEMSPLKPLQEVQTLERRYAATRSGAQLGTLCATTSDSGCLTGRGENSNKCCMWWDNGTQKVNGHFPSFYLLERHSTGRFTTFFLHRKGTLKSTLPPFVHWKSILEGASVSTIGASKGALLLRLFWH